MGCAASGLARRNIERREAGHVSVVAGDSETSVTTVLADGADVVILDPPRSGCAASVLDAVAALEGDLTVIYASCEPRKLARDLKRLTDAGLRVSDVALFDMFPHTPHLEVLVALRRAQ